MENVLSKHLSVSKLEIIYEDFVTKTRTKELTEPLKTHNK